MNKLNLLHLKVNEVEVEASSCDWKPNAVYLSLMMNELQDAVEGEEKSILGHFTLDQICTLIEILAEVRERLKFNF